MPFVTLGGLVFQCQKSACHLQKAYISFYQARAIIMRQWLIFSTLLIAGSMVAHAGECPKIVGDYKCDAKDYPEEWSFESYTSDGVEVFDDGTETYQIDGQSHDVNWGFFAGTYVGNCLGGKMQIVLDGHVDDETPIHIVNDSTYSVNENGILQWHENYKYKGTDGQWRESQQDITCKPAPN
jgi:hypothetical protein